MNEETLDSDSNLLFIKSVFIILAHHCFEDEIAFDTIFIRQLHSKSLSKALDGDTHGGDVRDGVSILLGAAGQTLMFSSHQR